MKVIDKEVGLSEALALYMNGCDDIAFMIPVAIPDSLKEIRDLYNNDARFFTLKEKEQHFITVESIEPAEESEEEEGDDTPPSEPEAPTWPSGDPAKDFKALTIEEVVALPKASAEADAKADMAEEEATEDDIKKLCEKFGVTQKPEEPKKPRGRVPAVDRYEVIKMYEQGKTYKEIADAMGCSYQHVGRIVKEYYKK